MGSVNLKEARRRLGQLVDAAERGESVVITRRGREVVRLVSAKRTRRQVLPDLSDFRRSIRIKGASLSATVIAMRREGRY